ncbi:hypothetical protein Glove_21g279 [Diversispora epigaea]|uniref:Helicase superfamily 3 single-stranded DNA/RNA virus domain-containing protein n=1 Tax=Diversispora epigaea TaxID=1348612 RepID=A0A397JRU4_9GLOM|nr:hypothetical protein Glove_21g279 [Diversispora epigaea]
MHIEKAKGSYEEASNYCKAEFMQIKGTYEDLNEKNYKLYDGQKKRKRVEDPNQYFEYGTPTKHRRIFTEKEINPKKLKREHFWRPVIFYFYGEGGSGKTGLVNKLFSNELYSKPDNQKAGKNYWNDYNGKDNVLLDEFYTKITWSDACYNVESKYGGFQPFIAKYIFLTNTQPPHLAYRFGKYNNGFMSTVELVEKVRELNKDIDGEIIVNNEVYWRQHFENCKIEYLRKYPYVN